MGTCPGVAHDVPGTGSDPGWKSGDSRGHDGHVPCVSSGRDPKRRRQRRRHGQRRNRRQRRNERCRRERNGRTRCGWNGSSSARAGETGIVPHGQTHPRRSERRAHVRRVGVQQRVSYWIDRRHGPHGWWGRHRRCKRRWERRIGRRRRRLDGRNQRRRWLDGRSRRIEPEHWRRCWYLEHGGCLRRQRVVCRLSFDESSDSYDCKSGSTVGSVAKMVAQGLKSQFCTGAAFGSFGVAATDANAATAIPRCDYDCDAL